MTTVYPCACSSTNSSILGFNARRLIYPFLVTIIPCLCLHGYVTQRHAYSACTRARAALCHPAITHLPFYPGFSNFSSFSIRKVEQERGLFLDLIKLFYDPRLLYFDLDLVMESSFIGPCLRQNWNHKPFASSTIFPYVVQT